MKTGWTAGASIAALVLVIGPAAGTAGAALPPITLTEAGVDAQRRPTARWTPEYPIVNIVVATRPVRDASTRPARRYWVQSGFHDRPEPFWRGDDPVIPGVYYTAIQGDAPFQGGMPWTPFKRFRVNARRGEWTGPTSQQHYIRFTRPGQRALRGLSLSVHGTGMSCEAHSSFTLAPRQVRVREDGSFSARFPGVTNRPRTSSADILIKGRARRRFARGVLRVSNLFEGCDSGRVRWSARRR